MEENSWQPKIKGWWNVDIDAYKFIYESASKRLEDLISETVSTTDKSEKNLIFVLALASFSITFFSTKNIDSLFVQVLITLAAIVFVYNLYLIYKLLAGKDIYRVGLPPKLSFRDDLDSDDNKDNQLQLTYYNAVCIIENSIEKQRELNENRFPIYNKSITTSTILLLIIAVCTAFIIRG